MTKKTKKILKYIFLTGFIMGLLGVLTVVSIFIYFSMDVYGEDELKNFNPETALKIYDCNGNLIALFHKPNSKKTIIKYQNIPKKVVDAFVSVEDKSFFEHSGIDYIGIMRAIVIDIVTLSKKQGASTITQQVAKNLLLSNEKTFSRKIKEMILARRIEKLFNKEEILSLYINNIYFGQSNYGVVEAARFYFNKSLDQLDIGEIAYLAGLPKNPEGYALNKHPKRAKKRQIVVLGRMKKMGIINEKEYDKYREKPLKYSNESKKYFSDSSYFTRYVLKELKDLYGSDFLYHNSISVLTTLDVNMQKNGVLAIKDGLHNLNKRQGILKPIRFIRKEEDKKLNKRGHLCENCVEFKIDTIDDKYGISLIETPEGEKGILLKRDLKWVKHFNPYLRSKKIYQLSKMFSKKGIYVAYKKEDKSSYEYKNKIYPVYEVLPVPKAQGALISIDVRSRDIKAMVGGYDFKFSQFNRATQAKRQPGSVFKPFIYSTAVNFFHSAPSTIVYDLPTNIKNLKTGVSWKPLNFKKMNFRGAISMITALSLSVNMVAVKLFMNFINSFEAYPEEYQNCIKSFETCVKEMKGECYKKQNLCFKQYKTYSKYVEDCKDCKDGYDLFFKWIRSFGITTPIKKTPTISLGSADVKLSEITNAMATFPAKGVYKDIRSLISVKDGSNKEYYKDEREEREVLGKGESYIMVQMLQSVVKYGTARRVSALKHPAGGKTGTTNNSRNVWFVGFTKNIATGVWVGFDDMTPLGKWEQGGRTSGPIWLEFMKNSLKDSEVEKFEQPEDIVTEYIDPETGLKVGEDFPNKKVGIFVKDYLPEAKEEDSELMNNILTGDDE